MQPDDTILDRMKAIIRNNDICVLATTDGSRPHTSLMAYVWADDGLTIYLLTRKGTRKFRNLSSYPDVSLLVDTRCDSLVQSNPLSDAVQRENITATPAGTHTVMTNVWPNDCPNDWANGTSTESTGPTESIKSTGKEHDTVSDPSSNTVHLPEKATNKHTNTQALTITGRAEILSADEAGKMLELLAHQHPQIKGLATAEDAAVIRIKTVALQLLDGAETAFLEKI